jgi:hypothetical protein
MDKELKATILALCNELEDAMGEIDHVVEDMDVTHENIAFVREGLEYL